jgi:hypothetical protein
MRPRVAVCLTGEVRGINSCVPTLYKNILEPLSAGIFYCFNKHNPEKDNKISVFNNRLIKGRIYEKPDLRKTLVPDSLYSKLDEQDFYFQSNWLGTVNGCTGGVCYRHWDFKNLAFLITPYVNDYDYFIVTRTDFHYLFPIFDFSILNGQEIIKHSGFDNTDGKGMNWEFIICHRSKILEYLNSPYLFMNDPMLQNYMIQEIRQRHRNNECFQKIIAEFYEWKISEMDINSFISADSMQERTTWGEIDLEKNFGVCFKYRDMMYKAYDNYERFKVNKSWVLQDQFIKVL